ncbi:MAG: oligosaccharide flippase family protein [Acidobacteriaceae bacterium]|nr:oligosaccharide flippase family protein [Acidobacteriaceae bacterium]
MTLKSIVKGSSVYVIGDLIRRSISFLLLPFYTRFLTPSDYGLLEILDLAIMITALVFGISASGDAMIRVYHDQTSESDRGSVVSTMMWLVFGLGTIVSAAGMFCAKEVSLLLLHSDRTRLVQLAFFTMAFGGVTELLMLYQQVRKRHLVWVCCSLAQTLGLVALNIYFIAGRGMGIWGFLFSKCIVFVLSAAILLVVTIRETSWRFRWPIARDLAIFGGPLILSSLATFSIHFSDRFFVNKYCSLADLGIYALAYKIGMLVSVLVAGPFGAVWNANFYAELKNGGWRGQFSRTLFYFSAVSAFVVLALSVFARPLLSIAVTPAYWGAIAIVPVVALSYGLRSIGDFFRGILFITRRSKLFSAICATCAAFNLVLNALLIPSHGIAGAAWATLLTWAIYLVACFWFAHRENPIPVAPVPYLSLFGVTAGFILVSQWVTQTPVAGQLLLAATLLALFIIGLFVSGGVSRSDREFVFTYVYTGRMRIAEAIRGR